MVPLKVYADMRASILAIRNAAGLFTPNGPTAPDGAAAKKLASLLTIVHMEAVRSLIGNVGSIDLAESFMQDLIGRSAHDVDISELVRSLVLMVNMCETLMVSCGVDSTPIHDELHRHVIESIGSSTVSLTDIEGEIEKQKSMHSNAVNYSIVMHNDISL